ncbi:MAG: DUF6713 family protein [Kangiellaceae bacterium]
MSLERLYGFTLILLILHQIDAAYWKEWEMFYLPGGIQGFLLFNLVAFPIIVVGYKKLLTLSSNYLAYSYACGGLGLLTFIIHAGFAMFGFEEFHLPLSIAVIVLCGVFGVWQLILTKQSASRKAP